MTTGPANNPEELRQFWDAVEALGFEASEFTLSNAPEPGTIAVQRITLGQPVVVEYSGTGHSGNGWAQKAAFDLKARRFGALT